MNNWVTADLHLHHANLMAHCRRYKFMTPEEIEQCKAADQTHKVRVSDASVANMDDYILNAINDVISANDTLYILGDLCLAKNPATIADIRDKITCKNVHLILGNHDRAQLSVYQQLFTTVSRYRRITYNNETIIMCHYPLLRWDKSHYGSYHLYGHCHGSFESWIDEHLPGARMKDVGIDANNYLPHNLDDLHAELMQRPGCMLVKK